MSSEKIPIASGSNFIRGIVERDLAGSVYASPRWAGSPGDAAHHAAGKADPAKIRTRFPPEPNGYLHIGHAKSICLNFGLARDYGGVCHLRFDDTNPEKEEQEYVDAITDAVQWLGFGWDAFGASHLYYASNYFDFMFRAAEHLIKTGHAYVDEQSADEMRANRGTLTEGGKDSPWRNRAAEDNLRLFHEMRDGKHADGSMVLRAKIDMASPNINLRDPAIYRIKRATHHNTGDKWCIYPMYTYAHPIEDALEQITHSICTLEFEDQRPFYDWLLERLAEGGLLVHPLPKQYEFARLNLTYVVLSKRRLIELVQDKHVSGWDDPRLPTLAGARRRGYTAEGFRLFAERIGVSKADSWIEYTILEDCMREVLNESAERRIAVLDPIKLVIDNYPENQTEDCFAPNHPQKPELGKRTVPLTRELWIEREDFMETPSKGYFRLFPDNMVRLRYGYVVKCTGFEKDAAGNVTVVHCDYLPDTKSGTPGSDAVKVKGNIHWVSATHAYAAEVRLYDRLFKEAHPGAGDRDYLNDLNPDSAKVITAQLELALKDAKPEDRFQFERHGYFVADSKDSKAGTPVFNRAVTLRDAWQKKMVVTTEKKIIIIAGPNGAGKTTFAREFLPNEANCPIFINADLIAVGLAPFSPETASIKAGRLMLKEIKANAQANRSFAFETTLSGKTYVKHIANWKKQGYHITMVFLSLPNAEFAIARVAARVAAGGHNIPEAIIRRRFKAGINNFQKIYKELADNWALYDNSSEQPIIIERGTK